MSEHAKVICAIWALQRLGMSEREIVFVLGKDLLCLVSKMWHKDVMQAFQDVDEEYLYRRFHAVVGNYAMAAGSLCQEVQLQLLISQSPNFLRDRFKFKVDRRLIRDLWIARREDEQDNGNRYNYMIKSLS